MFGTSQSKGLARISYIFCKVGFFIIWILGMPTLFLVSQDGIKLTTPASTWSWILIAIGVSTTISGIYEKHFAFTKLPPSGDPETRLEILDADCKSYLDGWHSGPKYYKRVTPDYDEEHIATRKFWLACAVTGFGGPLPMPFSWTMTVHSRSMLLLFLHATLRGLCTLPGAFLDNGCLGLGALVVEAVAVAVFVGAFLWGRHTQWEVGMEATAGMIRRRCEGGGGFGGGEGWRRGGQAWVVGGEAFAGNGGEEWVGGSRGRGEDGCR